MTEETRWRTSAIEFIDNAYFGRAEDVPQSAGHRWDRYVDRAYRDACRTITYRSAWNHERTWRPARAAGNIAVIEELKNLADVDDENGFDEWHRRACESLQDAFHEVDDTSTRLTVGQAQKWINMAIKNLVAATHLGLKVDFDAAQRLFEHFHAPLDSISIRELRKEFPHAEPLKKLEPWSKIDSYDTYFAAQSLARQWEAGALAFDFDTWSRDNPDR